MTQQQALNVLKTGVNVFLTGEPGSGKTYTINEYIRYLRSKNIGVAITASTGIAATHIGGITIHSWSGIGIKQGLKSKDIDRIAMNKRITKRIQKARVLIIDEASMINGQTLEDIDQVCQAVKSSPDPFGGLQVVLVGDFFQLPPVKNDGDAFAFMSPAWARLQPVPCYITEQHRQTDDVFLNILSALRENAITSQHRKHLDSRCELPSRESAITHLFSHNANVDQMNNEKLAAISKPGKTYHMATQGNEALLGQLKRGCMSPEQLTLKKGAVVMFTKNHKEGRYVNGTLGRVVKFDKESKCPVIQTIEGKKIIAEPTDWVIEEDGRVLARISQLPLRLAWAITVHKSQGMSLDAAVVDIRQAFTPGQGYVALSRVRTLNGLYLQGYNETALQIHPTVAEHDVTFRAQSELAADTLADARTLKKQHRDFIRAARKGGK